MHPFGSLLVAREWLDEPRSDDAWRALHRRPDAPPLPAALPAEGRSGRARHVLAALRALRPTGVRPSAP